jgi:hypothetical protein
MGVEIASNQKAGYRDGINFVGNPNFLEQLATLSPNQPKTN